MPRNASPAVLAQVAAAQLRPAFFVRIKFLTETVYIWGGLGTLAPPGPGYDPTSSFPYGQSFIGVGWLGKIAAIPQVGDIVAQNISLTLSGIPTELVSDAVNAVRQNSQATVWLGFLDITNSLVNDPVQVFFGALDVPTLTEGAETCAITITAENPLIDLNRAPSRRYTDVDQQIDYPGDTGFSQVELLQDYNIVWPFPFGAYGGGTPPPNFLTISPNPAVLRAGATLQMTCSETRSDGAVVDVTSGTADGGSWSTSDPGVATVDVNGGLVTGVAAGFCVITKQFRQGMFTGKVSQTVQASQAVTVTT
jgi:hypothetical protein